MKERIMWFFLFQFVFKLFYNNYKSKVYYKSKFLRVEYRTKFQLLNNKNFNAKIIFIYEKMCSIIVKQVVIVIEKEWNRLELCSQQTWV